MRTISQWLAGRELRADTMAEKYRIKYSIGTDDGLGYNDELRAETMAEKYVMKDKRKHYQYRNRYWHGLQGWVGVVMSWYIYFNITSHSFSVSLKTVTPQIFVNEWN